MSYTSHNAFLAHAGAKELDEELDEDEMRWESVGGDLTPSLDSVSTISTGHTTPDPACDSGSLASSDLGSSRRSYDRTLCKTLHQTHTLALLASVRHRNALINDSLLHARLLSLTPMSLQDAFSTRTGPDPQTRVDAFDKALKDLLSWWFHNFDIDPAIQGLRYQSYDSLREHLDLRDDPVSEALFEQLCQEGSLARTGETHKSPTAAQSEVIRGSKSLMKRALSMCGSADMSTLLFVALCRALRLQTRLVANLQPVLATVSATTTAKVVETPSLRKRRSSASTTGVRKRQRILSAQIGEDEWVVPEKTTSRQVEMMVVASGSAEDPISLDSPTVSEAGDEKPVVKTCRKRPKAEPPVYWAEVYSTDLGRWISVDVARKRLHCEQVMAPLPGTENNRLTYVVACERDGHTRDVTLRYAEDWYARGWRERPIEARGADGWWETALEATARRYRVKRDRKEDEELSRREQEQLSVFPSIVGEFKDHPKYVLERFLKRDEACHPRSPIGLLWNKTEYVFLRSSVVQLRPVIGWQRLGRTVCESEIDRPIKQVLSRAGRGPDEGLYAKSQTALWLNAPVALDGQVAGDDDGHVHVLQPHMLPKGGVHLTFKGAVELAKKHSRPFAKAIVALNVRKGKTVPVLDGIVVSQPNGEFLQQIYEETVSHSQQRANSKLALDRWRLLLRKLAIKQRLVTDSTVEQIKADDVVEFDL